MKPQLKTAAKGVLGVGGISTAGLLVLILQGLFDADTEIRASQKELRLEVKSDMRFIQSEFKREMKTIRDDLRTEVNRLKEIK